MESISETLRTIKHDIDTDERRIPSPELSPPKDSRFNQLRDRFRLNILGEGTINVGQLAETVAELTLEPEGRWRAEFMSNGFDYIRAMVLAVEILLEQIAVRDFAILNRGAYLRGVVKKILKEGS